MYAYTRDDLHLTIDDHGFASKHLAVDLIQRLRRIAASRRAHAAALVGVHGTDVRLRIVERPFDALQLLALHIQHRIGKIHQLTRVIPVAMTDNDLGHVVGVEAQQLELIGQGCPMCGTGHLVIVLLLPTGVVQDQLFAALDDPDVDRQINRVDVVIRIFATGDESAIGHECAVGHPHEPTAFHQPDRTILRVCRYSAQRADARQQQCRDDSDKPFHLYYLPVCLTNMPSAYPCPSTPAAYTPFCCCASSI